MGRLFPLDALLLGDPFRPPFVLLPFFDAEQEAAEGGYRVSREPHEISRVIRLLSDLMFREPWTVRRFVSDIDRDRMITLHRSTNDEVLIFLQRLVSSGRLAVLAADEGARGDPQNGDEEDAAWAAYELFQARFGRDFRWGMRPHRLTTRDQVDVIRQRADYDVVPAPEAASIVKRMANDDRSPRLIEAAQSLSERMIDLKAPNAATGFVLLRAPVAQVARPLSAEEVITPAKLRELRDVTHVAFAVVDEKNFPLPGMGLRVVPSNGAQVTLKTNDSGLCKAEKIVPGVCEVEFSDFEADLDSAIAFQARMQTLEPNAEACDGIIEIPNETIARRLPRFDTAKTHKLQIRTWIEVLVATDVPESEARTTKARFRLFSAETGYDRSLASADDAIAGTEWVELLFEDVPRHGKYTCTSEVEGRVEIVFKDVDGTTLGHAMDELPASPPDAKTGGGMP